MIHQPVMYTTRFALNAAEQKALDLAYETLRRGRAFHPGQQTLARWLNRSCRQTQRYLYHLRDVGLLSWKRRGKKMANSYRLAGWLWRVLTKGRKIPGAVTEHKKEAPVGREEAKRLLAGILASLGPGG